MGPGGIGGSAFELFGFGFAGWRIDAPHATAGPAAARRGRVVELTLRDGIWSDPQAPRPSAPARTSATARGIPSNPFTYDARGMETRVFRPNGTLIDLRA
jgi:hypothetical protein